MTPTRPRFRSQRLIKAAPWRVQARHHGAVALTREIAFPKVSMKSLQYRQVLGREIKTMGHAAKLGRNSKHHNQSGQKEFELLKSQFLSNISHELRTPLNVIVGNLCLLLDGLRGDIGDEVRSGISKAMKGCYHMLSLVNNLLDLACLSAGIVQVQRQLVDLRALLEQLGQKWSTRVKEHRLVLLQEIPPSLPQIMTDKDNLVKILNNLLDNAVKFTSEGKIVLRACSRGDAVEIGVADTGVGISRDAQQLIFDDFRQVDSSETRVYQGMGLGLAVSEKLVSLLGGRMEVESEVGKGSTFRVILQREIPHASQSSDC